MKWLDDHIPEWRVYIAIVAWVTTTLIAMWFMLDGFRVLP